MSEIKEPNTKNQASATVIVAAVIVGLLIVMVFGYLGLTRYYNHQQLKALVEGADANGQSYSVVIHNDLTGKYSFNLDKLEDEPAR